MVCYNTKKNKFRGRGDENSSGRKFQGRKFRYPPYICSSYYVILLFRIASHTVTLKYFILLHIAYPEHLSKVKILLVPKVFTFLFTYVAFILCFIR